MATNVPMNGYPRQGSDVDGLPSVCLIAVFRSKASLSDINGQTRPIGQGQGEDDAVRIMES